MRLSRLLVMLTMTLQAAFAEPAAWKKPKAKDGIPKNKDPPAFPGRSTSGAYDPKANHTEIWECINSWLLSDIALRTGSFGVPDPTTGDWLHLPKIGFDGVENYSNDRNQDSWSCANRTFQDGKFQVADQLQRTQLIHYCTERMRVAARWGAEWYQCVIHTGGTSWVGWSPPGTEFCENTKHGKFVVGPCGSTKDFEDWPNQPGKAVPQPS